MKKSFLGILFFMLTIYSYATEYYVRPDGNDNNDGKTNTSTGAFKTIARATTVVPQGAHTINIASGTYIETTHMAVAPGVSLKGAGVDQTIIKHGDFVWYNGAIRLYSSSVTDGNQTLSDFTMDGMSQSSFDGIRIENRNNVKIFNIKIVSFYQAAIEVLSTYQNSIHDIEIYNFDIRESSRESAYVSSEGNIRMNGSMDRVFIHDGTIYHQTNTPALGGFNASGYAIKFVPSLLSDNSTYNKNDYISHSKIFNVKEYGKPAVEWTESNGQLRSKNNLGVEFWSIAGEEVEIYNCDFTTQLSLEYEPPVLKGSYSFWVHDNRFVVGREQSLEIAASNAIIEKNTFDCRNTTNAWNVLGEYNHKSQGGSNIHVRKNYFLLGDRSPIIWSLESPVNGVYFYNNTITGTGNPSIFEIRLAQGTAVSTNLKAINNVFDLSTTGTFSLISYQSNSASLPQPTNTNFIYNHYSKPIANIPTGAVVSNNLQTTPAVLHTGALPLPYLSTTTGSALINAGTSTLPTSYIAMTYAGSSPDIGAFEYNDASPSDTQSPSVPTNLSVVSKTETTVNLSWTASTDNVGVTGYDIYNGSVVVGTSNTTSYTVSGLTANTTYSFTVKAKDAANNVSAASTALAVTTTSGTPSVSNGLSGEMYSQFGVSVADGRSKISGQTPLYTFSSTLVDYPNGTATVTQLDSSWRSFLGVDGPTAPLQEVQTSTIRLSGYIQIKAENDVLAGNNTIEVDFLLATQGLAALTINGSQVIINEANWTFSSASARVSFPSAGFYPIEVFNTIPWNHAAVELYSSIAGTQNPGRGTTQAPYLVPQAVLFKSLPAVDTQAPSVPTNVTASAITGTSFTLSWNASIDNVGVSSYEVFRNGISIGTTSSTTFTLTGLASGTSYVMTVKAKDAANNVSAASTALTVTTLSNGLSGEMYSQFGVSVADGRSKISGQTPLYTFSSTLVDYPNGTATVTQLDSSWRSFLGVDGPTAPLQEVQTSTIRLSGYIQIKAENDVLAGNNTIEVDFLLATQGLAALTINGSQVIINEANWTFSSASARVSFPSAGFYPIEVFNTIPWNHAAVELYSSIAGTQNPGRGTTQAPYLIPQTILFKNLPAARKSLENGDVSKNSLTVYPNPTSNKSLSIVYGNKNNPVVIKIVDLTGRVVYNTTSSLLNGTTDISLEGIKAGVYILSVQENGTISQQKIVIQ
ncbi:fibronectin type III domain-containing protein [Xanthocytophaga agilis]|uniref:Fibronectin type III domain-containing protein n=1 Tax=Xanthocytophaga agilis TaxID=3048010 RepID=A0AAE3UI39_9BACT|nr:fibronectin type III domain-containing protein [Xanthocytophaga agilis]MDJ1506100.1 fibronectin type III domain-containing protein [Xanthocytophaga agilis]